MTRYTKEQYRAELETAIRVFPWLTRPLVRVALWWTERQWGTPDHPGRRGWPDQQEG